jgi:hypothetical protein
VADEDSSNKTKVKPHTIRLKDDLLCAYDKSVRPVLAHDTTTIVHANMLLMSLTVDEDIGSMNVHCWMVWSWLDEKLRWKQSDYGGVDVLVVDSDEIWVPEISQFGMTATWSARQDIHTGRCMVQSSGKVTCVPRTVYSTICTTDVTHWPYDVVKCSVVVGAWMAQGDEISVKNDSDKVFLHHYKSNPNWRLLSATSEGHVNKIHENSTFSWILYNFVLQRHAGMYEATVGIPALVVACLVLVSFWLPPLEENRIYISCVSLICHCLYLTHLGWKLKNSGDKNPLIVQLFSDSMLLSGLSVAVAIILRRLASPSIASPRWLSGVVSWVLSYRPGKLILTKLSPEMAAAAEGDAAEGAVLVGTPAADRVRGWALLGKLLNWVGFIIAALVYVVMFARCFA